MEKRLPIAMIVNLARAQNRNGTELTYTDNVSRHGACIVCNHPWQPGELRGNHFDVRSDRHAGKGGALPETATISTPSD